MAEFRKVEFSAEKISCSTNPISFDESKCIGCHRCADVCQCDVLIPQEKGKHPVVMYPGECYYCGCCVIECPVEGAISLRHPLMNRARFVPLIEEQKEG
ncbi:MAG: 4Fe-4S binding protein [Clostridia bacterium]|nr:4Fe-4S binding protein [Clostridia bacterium]